MKMKKSLQFLFILLIFVGCNPLKDLTKNSVFSVNAIQADDAYYTKAVLEYHLVNTVLKKFNPNGDNNTINLSGLNKNNPDSIIYNCKFNIPKKLKDLKSGFQYRYYLFNSNNTGALQAFGITDIKTEKETEYLVIDYIQFIDFKCTNLPTIRYAVGLRSELKFTKADTSIDIVGKGGLSKLAAQVELGNAEVNFSLKTIGLTGKPAKLNIPQGVSFNVTTYKDFQNSIEFLKNELESSEAIVEDVDRLFVNPEIIPVMDEYRPNSKNSIRSLSKEIMEISIAKDKINKKRNLSKDSRDRIVKLYDSEIKRILEEQELLNKLHSIVYSTKQYIDAIGIAVPNLKDIKRKELDILRVQDESKNGNTLFNFFPGYPNLNKFNANKLRKIEQIYYSSDDITLYEFNKFLNIIDKHLSTDSELDEIIIELNKNSSLKGLINAANKLEKK
jgi:hypothetical protein